MSKLLSFATQFFLLTSVIVPSQCDDLEDTCVIHYLKDKNLLNTKIFPDRNLNKWIQQKCDKLIPELKNNTFDKEIETLTKDDSKNTELKLCIQKEFKRLSISDKLLKMKIYENLPQIEILKERMKLLTSQIVNQCTKVIDHQAEQRFEKLTSIELNSSKPLHPAQQQIIDSYNCVIDYASEMKYFDEMPEAIFNETLSSDEKSENCTEDLDLVKSLIIDEWYIVKKYEDDVTQRCFIKLLEESEDVDLFIKITLFGLLKDSVEDETNNIFNAIENKFIEHQKSLHEKSYKCILRDFNHI